MNDWRFKPEDFEAYGGVAWRDIAATIANAKLAEWLAKAPVVYGFERYLDSSNYDTFSEDFNSQKDPFGNIKTHQARLICIKPIVHDSAENILKELVDRWKCTSYSAYDGAFVTDLATRAAKILEKK